MTIVRFGDFIARPESSDALRDFLLAIMPIIKSSNGCESVSLYQSKNNPTRFTMTEIWDSIESHQASAMDIPPEKLAAIKPLLASAPSGEYYQLAQKL
jgi:quinol monooxygenase YgiN